nr:MAG TPA: hypothetical protein [Caudoviricetes sp.]
MTKTKYYDLQMDDPQDDYDVEVVNANLKKIDEQMKTRENATDALQEPEFTVADKRENIASKEKMQKILGKIAKFFTDLKTVAFTGSYKDLSNKPTSLPASDVSAWAKESTKPKYTKAEVGLGNVDNTADANKSVKYATSAGNATKVNNYTVNANVPSDAKFTDTTYGVATTTKTGIVKPDGKTITADKDGTLHGADTIKVDGITITRDDATKVIALAKTLQDKIGTIGNKVDKNYVVNNLTTTKQGFVLDGRQGKALQDQITSLNGSLNKYVSKTSQGYATDNESHTFPINILSLFFITYGNNAEADVYLCRCVSEYAHALVPLHSSSVISQTYEITLDVATRLVTITSKKSWIQVDCINI